MSIDHTAVGQMLSTARERLLRAARVRPREPAGHWEGELSSSALATATTVFALDLVDQSAPSRPRLGSVDLQSLVRGGLAWLADHQNEDGGWGDTVDSPSNISTTALCWAAIGAGEPRALARAETRIRSGCTIAHGQMAAQKAEAWLRRNVETPKRRKPVGARKDSRTSVPLPVAQGSEEGERDDLSAARLAQAITRAYGKDRTFAVPILTMCALAGRFGVGRDAWRLVPPLPFELAACPHKWFRRIGLPVVSYALPALIAIGQARHHHCPARNLLTRCLRNWTRKKTLKVLQSVQPETGGFLEATPLTGFVVMALASMGLGDHPVVTRGVAFLTEAVRGDGSWPIDANLATWVTTLSINALARGGRLTTHLPSDHRAALRTWLGDQQYQTEHPYTHAAPGGWAWTDRRGGVPDADDTAGALLALAHLADRDASNRIVDEQLRRRAAEGAAWLLDLQSADGGIPTFCRGWGKLPFDRSSPDLTAHALRAWHAWRGQVPDEMRPRVDRATPAAIRYLTGAQREDGSWVPLWFGNQRASNQENPLYGTTRVLLAGEKVRVKGSIGDLWAASLHRGVRWVLSVQNEDGGWGGASSVPSSIEETALAVEALAGVIHNPQPAMQGRQEVDQVRSAVQRGCAWLVEHTKEGTSFRPASIGLYFATLWYFERLYPLIFTVSALERAQRLCPLL